MPLPYAFDLEGTLFTSSACPNPRPLPVLGTRIGHGMPFAHKAAGPSLQKRAGAACLPLAFWWKIDYNERAMRVKRMGEAGMWCAVPRRYTGPVRRGAVNHVRRGTEQH